MSRRARRVKPRPPVQSRGFQAQMRRHMAGIGEHLLRARADRRWEAEGFASWRAYCVARVGERVPAVWALTAEQVEGLVDQALDLATQQRRHELRRR